MNMRKCTPKKIIEAVPNIQSVVLPDKWFENLDANKSVFVSLYDWMLKNERVPSDYKESLHNRTYVGERIYKNLIAAEKTRLSKKLKIKGDELVRAVTWSDVNTGPKTEIGGCKISGDAILVIPDSSMQALAEFSSKIYREQRDTEIHKIKTHAAGATFYQWLLPQVDRPDRVGDLSRDIVDDGKFPRESIHYEVIKNYLLSQGACPAAIESLKEAWLEYLQQYPDRIQPLAWCSECGGNFDIKVTCICLDMESHEIFVLDKRCLSRIQGYNALKQFSLSNTNHNDIRAMVDSNEISEFEAKDLLERLVLWGIIPVEDCVEGRTENNKYARRPISNSKRYDVLRRDKFQCVLCGASGSGANLEVDHIIPVSQGGTSDMKNLRCLCFKCNRGKHAKIE
ncbi:MAG: HNH endonuclease [Desulfamplus sp.]|nr:HNH endonuclease [Desulfamplus sp.]